MSTPPPIREEDLHAFVDGETDAQTNAAVLALLATSPKDAARVAAWRHQNELIRGSFAKIEHDPIPLSLSLTPRNFRTNSPLRLVSSAASVEGEAKPRFIKVSDLAKLCAMIGAAFIGGMTVALMTPHISGLFGNILQTPAAQPAKITADLPLPLQTLEIASLREKTDSRGKSSLRDETTSTLAPLRPKDLEALGLSVSGLSTYGANRLSTPCLFLTTKSADQLTLCFDNAAQNENFGYRTAEAPPLRLVEWMEMTDHLALAGRLAEADLVDLARRMHSRISSADPNP